MKALIGVDGSEGSLAAVRFASRLLSPEHDAIVLYYAPPEFRVRSGRTPDDEVFERMINTLTKAVFDKSRVHLPTELKVRTQTIVGTQSAKHGLIVAADECRADMIVVGERGTGPMQKMPLGSVGRAVVHASTIPVLVVRDEVTTRTAGELRVLLACDATESSKYARQVLDKIAWPENTVGCVITVVESPMAGNLPPWLEEQLRQADFEIESDAAEATGVVTHIDELREHIRDKAANWCDELPAPFRQQQPMVVQGHASKEILKVIEAEKIDLVVLGSRGLGPLQRLFVGSTSEHLLTHAPCSVLIARQHEAP